MGPSCMCRTPPASLNCYCQAARHAVRHCGLSTALWGGLTCEYPQPFVILAIGVRLGQAGSCMTDTGSRQQSGALGATPANSDTRNDDSMSLGSLITGLRTAFNGDAAGRLQLSITQPQAAAGGAAAGNRQHDQGAAAAEAQPLLPAGSGGGGALPSAYAVAEAGLQLPAAGSGPAGLGDRIEEGDVAAAAERHRLTGCAKGGVWGWGCHVAQVPYAQCLPARELCKLAGELPPQHWLVQPEPRSCNKRRGGTVFCPAEPLPALPAALLQPAFLGGLASGCACHRARPALRHAARLPVHLLTHCGEWVLQRGMQGGAVGGGRGGKGRRAGSRWPALSRLLPEAGTVEAG